MAGRNSDPSGAQIEMLQQSSLTGDSDTTAGAAPRSAPDIAGDPAAGTQAAATPPAGAPSSAAPTPSPPTQSPPTVSPPPTALLPPTLPTATMAMAAQPASASLIQLPPKPADVAPPPVAAAPTPPAAPAPQLALATPIPSIPPAPAVLPAAILLPPSPAAPPQEAPDRPLDKAIGTAIASGTGLIPPSPDSRRNAPPRYPDDAKKHGIEGRVLLLIDVGADGHVLAVDLERGSGSTALDRAARDAALHWHFHPALSGSTEVESNFETEIIFQLTDK